MFDVTFPSVDVSNTGTKADGTTVTISESIIEDDDAQHVVSINGTVFDESSPQVQVGSKNEPLQDALKSYAIEEWTIINNSDQTHPFHIHVNPFQVVEVGQLALDSSGAPVQSPTATPAADIKDDGTPFTQVVGQYALTTQRWSPELARWQDTMSLPPRDWVKIRSRFNDFQGTYVLHCHILNHEDQGMMLSVNVGNPNNPKVIQQWASKVISFSTQSNTPYSASQALYAPNVYKPPFKKCTGREGAWTPAVKDKQYGVQYIEVGFSQYVRPTKVTVFESYTYGFVTKLGFTDPNNKTHYVEVNDTLKDCGYSVFNVAGQIYFPVNSVKVYVGPVTKGWQEIDAIQLEGVPVSKYP